MRNISESQIGGERFTVDLAAPPWVRGECLELRTEDQRSTDEAVVKRLFTDAIASKREHSLGAIPDRQREHSHHTLECLGDAVSRYELEQYFGVGMAAPSGDQLFCGRFLLQLPAKLAVVVYLAIED